MDKCELKSKLERLIIMEEKKFEKKRETEVGLKDGIMIQKLFRRIVNV